MFRGGVSAVSDIHWIEGTPPPCLAIVLRPRGDDWLEHELRRIAQSGIDTVISLLEPDEAELLGLGEERATAERVGLEFLSYPIPDGQVPKDMARFRTFI